MSLNEFAVIFGGFVAAFFAGFLGLRRGDNKASSTGGPPPFSLVGPTLADSVLMQRQIDAMGRLADSIDNHANALQERKADKITEQLERLAEKLDGVPRTRR